MPTLTQHDIDKIMETMRALKGEARTWWERACAVKGIDPDEQFIDFPTDDAALNTILAVYSQKMCDYNALYHKVSAHAAEVLAEARRARRSATVTS